MSYKLVIVESPVKANTIEKYLGTKYKVISCNGHVRDLPKKEFAIDVEKGFEPTYTIHPDKVALIATLKRSAHQATEVLLATDDDREGEAISWHLYQALDLDKVKSQRIFFIEITQQAIVQALEKPRSIDMNRVNAQQARRILDRLVGYKISPILWKKIKTGLSAGRVQSVAVRFIVERERAIHNFIPKTNFKVTVQLNLGKGTLLQAELAERLKDEKVVRAFLQACISAAFIVKDLKKTTSTRLPAPPFTTSTLQQEASQRLGYSVSRTMVLAQRLYEQGHITYMRTDSTNLAKGALQSAKKAVIATYGANYHYQRVYTTKNATAQQAHEAIRPTRFQIQVVSKDPSLQRLYKLIWQRAIASQMAAATIERNTVVIGISTREETLTSKAERITFKGFLAAYDQKDEALKELPSLAVGQKLLLEQMKARQTFTQPPSRYTEASLVKRLEEEGIGRPSTYAPTISTIQQRGYVVKESRPGKARSYKVLTLQNSKIQAESEEEVVGVAKNKLFPTDMALLVTDFLNRHFANITNYQFTAQIESQLDAIAQNKTNWQAMLSDFYRQFSPQVDRAVGADTNTLATVRDLGDDPKTGKPVIARLSRRYGPLVQIGAMDDAKKPRFASLQQGQFLETITLEQALKLFDLPREVGIFEDSPIVAQVGRYGPYLKHENKFYSLGRDLDPYNIDEHQAISLIKAVREAEAKKIVKTFSEDPTVQICNGRWGVYIKTPEKNVKVPKDKEAAQLTLQECLDLVAEAPDSKRRFSRGKK